MNNSIYHELTRRDHYVMACEYWLQLVELMDERALAIWLARQRPPLDERGDEAISRALFYKVDEVENLSKANGG